MQLVLFGAPGVGKGTQAKIISEKLNIKHISTGDLLREAIKNESQMGIEAKKYMDKGDLVPDIVIGGLIKETLSGPACKDGYILDGYPRSLDQVLILEKILKEIGTEELLIIKLNADEDVLVDRLTSRRQCSNCSSIVNLNLIGSKDVCPICNAKNTLQKRKDDDETVIRNRLNIYNETTKPVIEYYAGKMPIVFVDATKSVNQITSEIFDGINQHS